MARPLLINADVERLSASSDDNDNYDKSVPADQTKKKKRAAKKSSSDDSEDSTSNRELMNMILKQNETLMKLIEMG